MPSRQNKQKEALLLSRELRRRFYKGAAIATTAYAALSLVRFHGRFPYLPYELAIIWAVFLLCYTSLKEVLRWSDAGDEEVYRGELWVGIMLAGAAWMIIWNIGRTWIFHLQSNPFPEDYESAVIETITLYTLSVISSFLYKYKKTTKQSARRRVRLAAARKEDRKPLAAKEPTIMAQPASQNGSVEVVLTKAPPAEENKSPKNI